MRRTTSNTQQRTVSTRPLRRVPSSSSSSGVHRRNLIRTATPRANSITDMSRRRDMEEIDNEIHIEGIKNIDKIDIDNANALGYKIKLLGVSELIDNKVYQRVHPTLIKKSSYVASIDGVLNAVIVDGKPVGQSTIQGEGAGPAATTSALISDISSILRGNIKFPFSISNKERKKLKFDNIDDRSFSAYLRFEVLDKSGVLSNITNVFSNNKVSIKRLIQNPNKNKGSSSIIIISHKSKNKFLTKVLKVISKKKYIKAKPKLIRIDEN